MINIGKIYEEYIKCYSDKSRIYMIEEYMKTYDATQRKEVRYELFPRQKELCVTLGEGTDLIATKPRQAGITTTVGAFSACEIALADPESPITVLVIGNTIDLAQQMVTKIREFLYQLPMWMFGQEYWNEDYGIVGDNKKKIFTICNTKELMLTNGCRVVARSSGPDASRGVGGVTYLIFDEAAFIENGKDVYASAVATVSTGGHIIMISTPNGKDLLYYETYRQAKNGTNSYKLIELKWYQDPRYNKYLEWMKKKSDGEWDIIPEDLIDEKGNIEYNEAHWENMISKGYLPRSPWYVRMCKSFNNNTQKIAQELDVSFLGSDSNVIDPSYIEMQEKLNVREPNEDYKDQTLEETWIWKLPIEGHRYIMSIDNSRGDAEDSTSLEIFDLDGTEDDGTPCIEQVLEYNGKLYGDVIGEIADNYGRTYNNAFCVVESIGGYGDATLLTLMNLKYPNLYYDDPMLKTYASQNDASRLNATKDGLPGFHSSSLRFQMLSNFANLIKTNQFKIRSKRVIEQLETWIFKNGRMDHKDGCHDDNITCLAMGLFIVEFSIKRQENARTKDEAMLKAMIQANSRITNVAENGYKRAQASIYDSKKYLHPLYNFTEKATYDVSTKYKTYEWLIK